MFADDSDEEESDSDESDSDEDDVDDSVCPPGGPLKSSSQTDLQFQLRVIVFAGCYKYGQCTVSRISCTPASHLQSFNGPARVAATHSAHSVESGNSVTQRACVFQAVNQTFLNSY